MPQALPMVAAWAATAWTSAVTVTAGALASVGTVAAIGEGATIALASGILKTAAVTAISAAATALMRPNTPSSGTTLDFKPDPKAPVRGAMGFTAVGGNKVFQATWGYKRVAMSLGVALSLGPIQGVAAFEADGSTVAFNPANQYEALGFYDSDMWQRTTLGLPGDAALLPPTGLKYGNPGLTGWGLQNAAPQTAFAFWTMVLAKNPEDRDIFTNGVPDPRWILNGMRVWQPRFDSTYPGGSGPQRRDDWRTWGWSENPYDHALAWVRGHYKLNLDGSIDKTKRIAGVGAPDSAIDIPAFVEGANIADANGWTISGEWSTSDGKWQTLIAMLQAGGGQPINRGAQISVLVNAPRVSTYTYTKADLVGQAQIKPLTPRRDRKNTIIPRYRSQPNGWEYVAAREVSASTYRTEDRGEQRSTEVEYVHVRDARQAGQLAAYDLVNLREGLTATLPSKVHLMSVHAGDCITVDVPELALANQKFVVMRTTVDYKSAGVTLELRSETDAKHAFALGQTDQAPPSPTLSAVDPKYVEPPLEIDWGAAPKPPVGGISQPIIVIGGKVETGDIASVIVEAGLTPAGPWTLVYSGIPILDGRYEAKGLDPLAEYWFSIRYVARNGAISDRLVKGPYVAPPLTAEVSKETVEQIVSEVTGQIEGIATGRDAAEHLAEVVLETILDEQQKLESEASQRVEDLLNEAGARNTAVAAAIQQSKAYTDNFASSASQTFATITALNGGLAATLNEAKSFTTGQLSSAMLTVYTKAQTDAGLATTLQSARSYTDTYKSEAQLLFSTKAERASGDANAVIEAKAYTDDYKTQASLTFATQVAMGQANAATLSSAQSYSDGKLATALNTVYTKAQTDSALSTTLQQARSYSDDKAAEASLLYSTKTERANGDASTLQSAKSYTDDYKSTAALTFATQSSLNGVSATAALALSTSQDAASKLNEARIRIVADAQGGQAAVVEIVSSTGAGSYIRLGAQQIGFGDNTVFDDATDTLQTVINGRRRVLALGAPFGQGGNLIEWWGPSNIGLGSMTTGNGDNGRMTASPYVFDNTLASAFSASTNTGFIGGARNGAGPVQTSNSVTVTVSGGTTGATIRWVRLSGDSRINMNDPTAFTTGAYATIGVGEVISAYFMGAVTKSGKSAVVYVQVDLSDNGT